MQVFLFPIWKIAAKKNSGLLIALGLETYILRHLRYTRARRAALNESNEFFSNIIDQSVETCVHNFINNVIEIDIQNSLS